MLIFVIKYEECFCVLIFKDVKATLNTKLCFIARNLDLFQ